MARKAAGIYESRSLPDHWLVLLADAASDSGLIDVILVSKTQPHQARHGTTTVYACRRPQWPLGEEARTAILAAAGDLAGPFAPTDQNQRLHQRLMGQALLRTMQGLAFIHRPTHWREGHWPMWWEYQLWEWVERPDTGPLTPTDVLTIRLLALRSGSWVRYDAHQHAPVVIDRATWEATYQRQLTVEGGGRPWDPDHDWR